MSVALGEFIDAAVISAVLVLDALVGFVQERQAERSVHALRRLLAPIASVRAGRALARARRARAVPGDVVQLSSGRRVPADVRLVETSALCG